MEEQCTNQNTDNARNVQPEQPDLSLLKEDFADTTTFEEKLMQRWRERMKREMKEMEMAYERALKEALNPTQKTFQGLMQIMEKGAFQEKEKEETMLDLSIRERQERIMKFKETPMMDKGVFQGKNTTRIMEEVASNHGVNPLTNQEDEFYKKKVQEMPSQILFRKRNLKRAIEDERNILQFLASVKNLPAKQRYSKDYLIRLAKRHGLSAPLAECVVTLWVLNRRFRFSVTCLLRPDIQVSDSFLKIFGYVVRSATMIGIQRASTYQNSWLSAQREID
jgi:hypothetical protein